MNQALLGLPLETLQSRLNAALDALHRLQIGDQEVMIRVGDRTSQYQQIDIGRLEGYIAELRGAIAAQTTGTPSARRPVYLRF